MTPTVTDAVVFVARGTAEGGLGHIMRSRTLAAEMSAHTTTHLVAVGAEAVCRPLLEGRVDYSLAADDHACVRLVEALGARIVVFDLLDFDRACFEDIAAQALTVCVSPLFKHLGRVDLAFARAASPEHERLRPTGRPQIRTGCRYATIAPHCRRVDAQHYLHHAHEDPLAVAISMGGADAPNNTLRILEALRELPGKMLLWVVLGDGYTHSYQKLIDCVHADRRHEIILAKTTDSMWRILGACSVAILAGGITTYEAAFAGIPSVVALSDPRDRFLIDELVSSGACLYAGPPAAALSGITAALQRFGDNRELLVGMHRHCTNLLDDLGPKRIAEEILEYHATRSAGRESTQCASA